MAAKFVDMFVRRNVIRTIRIEWVHLTVNDNNKNLIIMWFYFVMQGFGGAIFFHFCNLTEFHSFTPQWAIFLLLTIMQNNMNQKICSPVETYTHIAAMQMQCWTTSHDH